jgi:phage terminase small subunit
LKLDPSSPGRAPEWFDQEAKAEWKRLAGNAEYSKVLSSVHRGTLIEYCVLFARMVAEAKGLGKLTASERQTLNSLRMQLGITPASQSKVRAPQAAEPNNKWAEVG